MNKCIASKDSLNLYVATSIEWILYGEHVAVCAGYFLFGNMVLTPYKRFSVSSGFHS